MAKTTGITKRRVLKFLYGFILSGIFLLLAWLTILALEWYNSTVNVQNSLKEALKTREELIEDFNSVSSKFTAKQSELIVLTDYDERAIKLDELVQLNNEAQSITKGIVMQDVFALSLRISEEKRNEIEGYRDLDEKQSQINEMYQLLLEVEIAINEYYRYETASKSCYAAINYTASNQEIYNALDSCSNILEKRVELFKPGELGLAQTEQYINTSRTYWYDTESLYLALMREDKPTTDQYRAAVAANEPKVKSEYEASTKEIDLWLSREIERITIEEESLQELKALTL